MLDGSYVIPNVFLNHLTTTITTSAAPRTAMVPFGPSFADPGTASGGGLSPLASTTQFLYEITNVQGNFIFQINWSFTPSGSWELNVYEGSGTGGNQIASTSGSDSPGRLIVPESDISGGTYTIRFYNNSVSATTSEEFSTAGDTSKTWVRLASHKDYLITSVAGAITLTSSVRQVPSPDGNAASDHVTSWHGPN